MGQWSAQHGIGRNGFCPPRALAMQLLQVGCRFFLPSHSSSLLLCSVRGLVPVDSVRRKSETVLVRWLIRARPAVEYPLALQQRQRQRRQR